MGAAFACAVGASLTMTVLAWPEIRAMSVKARLLADLGPSSAEAGLPRFVGALHPNPVHANNVLKVAERLGTYHARRATLHPTVVEASPSKPADSRRAGEVLVAAVQDRVVVLQGWTDVPATEVSRKLIVHPADGVVKARLGAIQARQDIALALERPEMLLSGFAIEVEFASAEQARAAALLLCVYVQAPGHETTVLSRPGRSRCG
jgi:hypothetical protein